MDKVFTKKLRYNVEVYMNAILVKSLQVADLIPNLEETFATLRKYHMWFNLGKCIFRVKN